MKKKLVKTIERTVKYDVYEYICDICSKSYKQEHEAGVCERACEIEACKHENLDYDPDIEHVKREDYDSCQGDFIGPRIHFYVRCKDCGKHISKVETHDPEFISKLVKELYDKVYKHVNGK